MVVSAWTIACGVASILTLLAGVAAFTYTMAYLTPRLIIAIRQALRQPMGYQTPATPTQNSNGNGHKAHSEELISMKKKGG